MAMSERQIQKEILRLKKEIDLIESQIQSGMKSKADKEQENKRLEDDINNQEEENTKLADELDKNEESITELDEEFKENQLKAGRIRKEMNLISEDIEQKQKEEKQKRAEIDALLNKLEDTKKKIKEEKHARDTSEYKLRQTNAKVAEIQSHWASKVVTSKIAREARKSGREADAIRRGEEDIKAYEAAARESQLAQAGVVESTTSGQEKETESKDVVISVEESKAEEKKQEGSGLDLDF